LTNDELKSRFLKYRNRQVVVNRYEEDELMSKDGFTFHEIQVEPRRILFYKEGILISELAIDDEDISVAQSTVFPNFYIFNTPHSKLEVYFP
jgi:hypothetical protein